MSVQSKDPTEIFPNFSSLFDQASQMNVTIDRAALSQILSATVHLDTCKTPLGDQQRAQALAEWRNLLLQNQGQSLPSMDLWEWIKKWLVPDPVQAERVWQRIQARMRETAGRE
jgi:hypothetical protein